jgi:hypothetical protein
MTTFMLADHASIKGRPWWVTVTWKIQASARGLLSRGRKELQPVWAAIWENSRTPWIARVP